MSRKLFIPIAVLLAAVGLSSRKEVTNQREQ